MSKIRDAILDIKREMADTIIAAHYYQKNEVFAMADIIGDSLELAKKSKDSDRDKVVFCGVEFMGQSVKILAPHKRVFMPKAACCAMARMIDEKMFDDSLHYLEQHGIGSDDIVPVSYINCSAYVKARIGQMNGYICTSSNADTIITQALQSGKKSAICT